MTIVQLAAGVGIPASSRGEWSGRGAAVVGWGVGFAVHDSDSQSPAQLVLGVTTVGCRVRSQTGKPVGAVLHSFRNVTATRRRRPGTVCSSL